LHVSTVTGNEPDVYTLADSVLDSQFAKSELSVLFRHGFVV